MKKPFSKIVSEKIQEGFSESEQKVICAEFEKLNEYFNENETYEFLESNEIERIYFGILKLSSGQISDFHSAIEEAKSDWRNILYWSEMTEEGTETHSEK